MKHTLVLVALLAGCARQPVEIPAPVSTSTTTVNRYTSYACERPEPESARLKAMTRSRDDWKRYAESLEKLPAAKPAK